MASLGGRVSDAAARSGNKSGKGGKEEEGKRMAERGRKGDIAALLHKISFLGDLLIEQGQGR